MGDIRPPPLRPPPPPQTPPQPPGNAELLSKTLGPTGSWMRVCLIGAGCPGAARAVQGMAGGEVMEDSTAGAVSGGGLRVRRRVKGHGSEGRDWDEAQGVTDTHRGTLPPSCPRNSHGPRQRPPNVRHGTTCMWPQKIGAYG